MVNASTGAYDVHPHRTSSGTHFRRGENDLISRIERRIAQYKRNLENERKKAKVDDKVTFIEGDMFEVHIAKAS